MRCFVCASTHGLKLFEFEFEWCTVRLGDSPQTLSSNNLLPHHDREPPASLSLFHLFFYFFFHHFYYSSCTSCSSCSFCSVPAYSYPPPSRCPPLPLFFCPFSPLIRPFKFSRDSPLPPHPLSPRVPAALSLPGSFSRTSFPKSKKVVPSGWRLVLFEYHSCNYSGIVALIL